MTTTLNYQDWYTLSYDYALTIKDVLNLKQGECIKVLSLDRNVWDIALNNEIRGKSLKPQEFFNSNWAIYKHDENLKGKYLLFEFECGKDIDETNVDQKMSLDDICQPGFEFHIEYKTHCWYPLKDGCLPGCDPQGFSKFPWNSDQNQLWTSFPETTRVGWRGPFVLWSKLRDMPNIIYPHPKKTLKEFNNENDITYDRHFKITSDDVVINSICNNFDWNRESFKWVANGFMWHVRDECVKNNIDFPISFTINISEITEKSKKSTYKYSITCEPDGEKFNGMQRMGRNTVEKID